MGTLNKWAILDSEYTDEIGRTKKVFDPHPGQLRVMEDVARFKVCACGRRFGKSNMCGHDPLVCEAMLTKGMATMLNLDGKRREFWTVGPEYTDAEKSFRVFWNKARALGMPFDKPGSYNSPNTGDMTVSMWDGAFIYSAQSAKNPDRLVGEGLSGVHIDEAAKLKEIVWTQMVMPTLADVKGWALFTSTPEGKNWFYDLYMNSIRPEVFDWNGFRMPSWRNSGYEGAPYGETFEERTIDEHVKRLIHLMTENPSFTSFEIVKSEKLVINDEIVQQANSLTIPTFQQEIAADFTDFVGKVFKGFDAETHVRRLEFHHESSWETVACVDYGYSNPNVWLLVQIGPWGEINIIDEFYQSDLDPLEFAQEVLERGLVPDQCHAFYPDPALPGYTKVLNTAFAKAGKRCRSRPHTGGELNERLNLIRLVIKNRLADIERNNEHVAAYPPQQDVRRPQMMVDPKCVKTIYEFGEYRYPEKKSEAETSSKRFDLPMKKDDHCPEAFGRMMVSRYSDTATQMGGGTRISKANFVRGMGTKGETRPMGDQPKGIKHATTPKRRGGFIQNR